MPFSLCEFLSWVSSRRFGNTRMARASILASCLGSTRPLVLSEPNNRIPGTIHNKQEGESTQICTGITPVVNSASQTHTHTHTHTQPKNPTQSRFSNNKEHPMHDGDKENVLQSTYTRQDASSDSVCCGREGLATQIRHTH